MAKEFTPFYGPICGAADDLTPETASQEAHRIDPFVQLLRQSRDALGLWPAPDTLLGQLAFADVAEAARLNRLANVAHDLAIHAVEAFSNFLAPLRGNRANRATSVLRRATSARASSRSLRKASTCFGQDSKSSIFTALLATLADAKAFMKDGAK